MTEPGEKEEQGIQRPVRTLRFDFSPYFLFFFCIFIQAFYTPTEFVIIIVIKIASVKETGARIPYIVKRDIETKRKSGNGESGRAPERGLDKDINQSTQHLR